VTWRRTTVLVVCLVVMVLTLASCDGHSSATSAQHEGTVVGVFGSAGGPAPGGFFPFASGSVTLRNARHAFSSHITSGGRFRIRALPDTYDVTGYGPQGHGCLNNPVSVQANRTTSVTVDCQIP
jgi:hypothetical protein